MRDFFGMLPHFFIQSIWLVSVMLRNLSDHLDFRTFVHEKGGRIWPSTLYCGWRQKRPPYCTAFAASH
jgi:hypothetical protein